MWKESLQTVASMVTVIAFLSGISSVPALFGAQPAAPLLTTDILADLKIQLQYALVLFLAPIFNIVDTWLTIAAGELMLLFVQKLSIGEHDLIYWSILLLVLLPMVVGLNMLFVVILFGDAFQAVPMTIGSISILTTVVFTFSWLITKLNHG